MKWIAICLLLFGCVSIQVLDRIYPVGIDNDSAYEVFYEIHGGKELLIAGTLAAGGRQLVQLPYGEYTVYVVYVGTEAMAVYVTEIEPGDYPGDSIPSFRFSSPDELPNKEVNDESVRI